MEMQSRRRHEKTTNYYPVKQYNDIIFFTQDKERLGNVIMSTNGVQIYKKAESEQARSSNKNITRAKVHTDVLYSMLSFLLSRAMFLGQLCPFGVSYFAASFQSSRVVYGIVAVLFGTLTAGCGLRSLQYAFALGFVCLYKFLVDRENELGYIWCALVAGAGNFMGGIVCMLFDEFLIYNLLVNVTESVLVGLITVLFSNVYAICHTEYKNLRVVNREEMLGILVLLGLCVCGLSDVVNFGTVRIAEILWSLLVLSFAYAGGLYGGLIAGASIGLIAAMTQTEPLNVVGFYTVCGLAAGLAQKGGKIVTAAVYLLTAVVFGLSTTIFAFGQIGLVNVLFAALVFAFLPQNLYEKHFAFEGDGFTRMQQKAYDRRINTLLAEKFMSLSNTFSGLSETIANLSVRKEKQFSLNYGKVMDEAIEKVCGQCSMRIYCWDKESENTCKTLAGATAKLKTKGYVDILDLGEGFRRGCIAAPQLIAAINDAYALRRINAVWEHQLNETRSLLGTQYKSFADVMRGFSKEITQKVVCESKQKNKIQQDVTMLGHETAEVYLYEREDESYDVELRLVSMEESLKIESIEKAVSSAMHQKMRVAVIDEYNCALRLEPQYNFCVSSSVATVKKDGEEENGDSYAVFNIRDNRCVLILSDGMGSGRRANMESKSAVSLLKKLLCVGFEIEAALQLVNSALVLKAGTESFATLDIAVIDLFSGETEFVKVGAAKGYIKQKGGVSVVRSSTLPIGILSDTQLQKQKHILSNGDCIVLVSDGIGDSKNVAGGLMRFLEEMPNGETEEIAKQILNFALNNRKGKADDDMTVLVAKIGENRKSNAV